MEKIEHYLQITPTLKGVDVLPFRELKGLLEGQSLRESFPSYKL